MFERFDLWLSLRGSITIIHVDIINYIIKNIKVYAIIIQVQVYIYK